MQYSPDQNFEHNEQQVGRGDDDNSSEGTGRKLVRKDLSAAAYRNSTLTRDQAAYIVGCILDKIVDAIADGEEVKLHGFGKFKVLNKKARVGRNPRTGVEAKITARRSVSFRPSPKLIAAVTEGWQKYGTESQES